MRWCLSFLLLAFLRATHALSSSGDRLLVVLEEAADKENYSTLWRDLEGRGFKVSFESPKNDKLALFEHGERAYDHLVLLPPKSKGYGPSLSPKLLLDFVNQEGNVLLTLTANSPTPTAISSLLLELDVHLSPDRASLVVDHFNYDTSDSADKHDVLLLPRPGRLRPDVKSFFSGDGVVAFPRAVGQTLGNSSPLLAPILRAPVTAYSYSPKDEADTVEEPFATGAQLALISSVQARNSARFTVLGSVEMLQNKWFDATVKGPKDKKAVKTVNRQFAAQLTEWTFKEVGVLKVGKVDHFLNAENGGKSSSKNVTQTGYLNPDIYRVKNDVTFVIEISEYSHDRLVPLEIPTEDALQLEFTMLSPFHRITLQPTSKTPNSTIYSTSFTLPDQHGIFRFQVNYKRPFLTNVDERRDVTVRHFAHDEWPRSWVISGAWVYIAGLWTVVAGFVLFVGLWLYSEPPKKR